MSALSPTLITSSLDDIIARIDLAVEQRSGESDLRALADLSPDEDEIRRCIQAGMDTGCTVVVLRCYEADGESSVQHVNPSYWMPLVDEPELVFSALDHKRCMHATFRIDRVMSIGPDELTPAEFIRCRDVMVARAVAREAITTQRSMNDAGLPVFTLPVEYRVMFKPTWSAVMLELHPLPDQPWRDRDHVTQSVSEVADIYTVHRRVDGGPWMLMVSVT